MQVKSIAMLSPFIKLPFVCLFLSVFFTGVAVQVQSCCTYTASMTLQDYIAEIAGGGGRVLTI